MGCVLGCFGGDKEQRRRKQRVDSESSWQQRSHVHSIEQESEVFAEQSTTEATPLNLDSELRSKPEVVKEVSPSLSLSPSPKKRVTFNSNITTYEHVPVHESIESLPEFATNTEKEKHDDLNASWQSNSNCGDDNSVISIAVLYPPNHRYHNATESDDEAEEYGDSDLDDLYDTDDEDNFDDYDDDDDDDDDDDIDVRSAGQEVWSESVETESMESRTANCLEQGISEEVDSVARFTQKASARDRSDYINSVLNPVENVTQWRAAKSKGSHLLKPQKENMNANFDAPHLSFSSDPDLAQLPSCFKSKADEFRKPNEEIAVDASLSNWLGTPEIKASRRSDFSGMEIVVSGQIISEGHTSFEDQPIVGAFTVEELKQISLSPSPRKSPCGSPDDMPIISTAETYWNQSGSGKCFDSSYSYRGIPNAIK